MQDQNILSELKYYSRDRRGRNKTRGKMLLTGKKYY